MGYAVELSFDDTSSSRITTIWEQLSRMYERPVGMELGVRPHVSLAVFPNLDPESIRQDILAVSRELATFTLRFSSIGQFDTVHARISCS